MRGRTAAIALLLIIAMMIPSRNECIHRLGLMKFLPRDEQVSIEIE